MNAIEPCRTRGAMRCLSEALAEMERIKNSGMPRRHIGGFAEERFLKK